MAQTQSRQDYIRQYYKQNRDRILARQRARYHKNLDAMQAMHREYYVNNREARCLTSKNSYAKRRISCPDICQICNCPPTGKRRLHYDHCHSTGKFRGWLCHNCNVGLGHAKESIVILQKMISYLEGHKLNLNEN